MSRPSTPYSSAGTRRPWLQVDPIRQGYAPRSLALVSLLLLWKTYIILALVATDLVITSPFERFVHFLLISSLPIALWLLAGQLSWRASLSWRQIEAGGVDLSSTQIEKLRTLSRNLEERTYASLSALGIKKRVHIRYDPTAVAVGCSMLYSDYFIVLGIPWLCNGDSTEEDIRRKESVLLHEIAHIAHGDILLLGLGEVLLFLSTAIFVGLVVLGVLVTFFDSSPVRQISDFVTLQSITLVVSHLVHTRVHRCRERHADLTAIRIQGTSRHIAAEIGDAAPSPTHAHGLAVLAMRGFVPRRSQEPQTRSLPTQALFFIGRAFGKYDEHLRRQDVLREIDGAYEFAPIDIVYYSAAKFLCFSLYGFPVMIYIFASGLSLDAISVILPHSEGEGSAVQWARLAGVVMLGLSVSAIHFVQMAALGDHYLSAPEGRRITPLQVSLVAFVIGALVASAVDPSFGVPLVLLVSFVVLYLWPYSVFAWVCRECLLRRDYREYRHKVLFFAGVAAIRVGLIPVALLGRSLIVFVVAGVLFLASLLGESFFALWLARRRPPWTCEKCGHVHKVDGGRMSGIAAERCEVCGFLPFSGMVFRLV